MRTSNMKWIVLCLALLAGQCCYAQESQPGNNAPRANANIQSSTNSAMGQRPRRGPGGFGGPIQLRADDKPAFDDPPAGFDNKRENIPHGKVEMIEYDY